MTDLNIVVPYSFQSSKGELLQAIFGERDLIADRRYGMAREFRERGDSGAAIDLLITDQAMPSGTSLAAELLARALSLPAQARWRPGIRASVCGARSWASPGNPSSPCQSGLLSPPSRCRPPGMS